MNSINKKPKFKYFGYGLWRGIDSLGRVHGFYDWKRLWERYDKIIKENDRK